MHVSNDLNIDDVENYLNRIFSLQCDIATKDLRITLLEFELAIQKQLLEALKKYYLPANSNLK